jgi:hypothetical protein
MDKIAQRSGIALIACLTLSCHFLVDPVSETAGPASQQLRLDKTVMQLDIGQIGLLTVKLNPSEQQSSAPIYWIYDPNHIQVSSDNYGAVVTALSPGDTTVTARLGTISTSCAVTVTNNVITRNIDYPYVYADAEFLQVTPGAAERVTASLFGGSASDVNGYSFTIDNLSVARLTSEGNYVWITGQGSGIARVTIRHNKSAYPYSFLVSCQSDAAKVPYLTTDSNIVTINKSVNDEITLYVDLVNGGSPASEAQLAYTLVDPQGLPLTDPPVAIITNGRQLIVKARSPGECQVSVSHPDAPYPLTILVRITETVDNVYIEPSSPVVYVSGDSSQILTASLVGVPPSVTADTRDFSWSFEAGYEDIIDAIVYGSAVQGSGDTIWITGKKPGAVRAAVSHPLAAAPRDVYIIVKDIRSQAATASFFITTSQNYIVTRVGENPSTIAVYINNALPGDEHGLHWSILNEAADAGQNPVISWDFGTGTHSSASRSAVLLPENQMVAGSAVVSPLRPGTAAITISHDKAVYDTVLIVTVKAAHDALPDPALVISTATPSLSLKNGTSTTVNVSLIGDAYEPGDEHLLQWSVSSDNISVTANGRDALLEAAGDSVTVEYITISHTKASPLAIPVVCYNTPADLAAFKYLLPDNPYQVLFQNQTATLQVTAHNVLSTDTVAWRVVSGEYTASLTQLNKTTASLTACYPGIAVIAAAIAGSNQEARFYVSISSTASPEDPPPAYLTTGQNVLLLAAGEEKTVYVTPVGIPAEHYGDITWENGDPALIRIIPNGDSAVFQAVAPAGKTTAIVSSPYSANTLTINVHIGDQYEYKNPDYVYISTSRDTLTLYRGQEDAVIQAVLVHSNSADLGTSGFSFSIANPAVAAIHSAADRVFITPVSVGTTVLTVSNPTALYPKEVLVIVEKEGGNNAPSPYITTAHNVITVTAGENVPAAVTLAHADGTDPASWSWNSDNPRVVDAVAQSGSTAMICGYAPGTASVTVTNTRAAGPLKLIVICIDAVVARQNPWIKTSANTLTLRLGSTAAVTAEMIGAPGEDAAFFTWSVNDGSIALVTGNGPSVGIQALREGAAYITVRNTRHLNAYSKTILVIAEKALTAGNYITVSNTVVRLRPDSTAAQTVRAALSGGSVTDPQDFIWWADDYKLIHLDSVTDTAQVQPLGFSGVTYIHVKHPKAPDVVDILILISNFDTFAFSQPSKTIAQGQIYFVPLQVPPASEKKTVTYRSYDNSVCTVAGSASVAMIAAVNPGQTTVVAELSSGKGIIAATELAVIVKYRDPNQNRLTTQSSILNLRDGQSMTIQAALQGAGIMPGDEHQITWVSGDSSVVSLLSSPQGDITGNSAYVTAHNPGKSTRETILTVSHPKCDLDLNIWIIVPGTTDAAIVLDQTHLELFKEDGAVSVTAALVNASTSDYNNIYWTAPKNAGATIISITKSQGKTCNIVPRTPGQTTLRAQLPHGAYADCIVIVKKSAELVFTSGAVHVVPGFSETISYSVNPQNAYVNWMCQFNSIGGTAFFEYSVDEIAKTITVTGKEIGIGVITGYFSTADGGAVQPLNVYVEHLYDLTLQAPLQVKLEPDEKTYKLPYTVYPRSMTVEAVSSHPDKLQVKSVSLNTRTGQGEIEVVPLGEQLDVRLTVKAANPRDAVNGVVTRRQTFLIYYDNVEFAFDFNYRAGAFSGFNRAEGTAGTLHLGDGETMTFKIRTPQKNLDISGVNVGFTSPASGTDPHVRLEQGANGGYIRLVKDPPGEEGFWRVEHIKDIFGGVGYRIKYKLQMQYFRRGYEVQNIYDTDGSVIGQTTVRNPANDKIMYEGDLDSPAVYPYYKPYDIQFTIGQCFYYLSENDYPRSPIPFTTFWQYLGYDSRGGGSDILELYLRYVPVTPYIVPGDPRSYLPAAYAVTNPNPGFTLLNNPPAWYIFDLGDSRAAEYLNDTDPAVDARHQAALNITYTRALDGKTYTYSVPVFVDERSCPAYMKP